MAAMADVSVRTATAADAAAITAVQLATWRAAYADLLPAATLDGLDAAEVEASWLAAIEHRSDRRAHVLVAVEAGRVVGLVALAPGTDDDLDPDVSAEIGPLLVGPPHQGNGHGSRLLAAAVDVLRADGLRHAVTWLLTDDEPARRFLDRTGWASDGATRRLDADGTELREVRWHTELTG